MFSCQTKAKCDAEMYIIQIIKLVDYVYPFSALD